MESRRLGRTGERIPTIGMGTWRVGVYATLSEKAAQVKALRRGMELGCTLIDSAEMYADGRSEEVVAEAVGGDRKDVFLATKVSPENLHHDDVIEACSRSLRRLKTSYIDLYQVHWPNTKVPIRETMTAMEELVRDGKIRYIGVSNFSVGQTAEARAALPKSELVSNQVEYSLSSRKVEADILPYCEREKLTLIAYTPLARGNVPAAAVPQAVCRRYNLTPIQAMLNWVTRSESVAAIPKSSDIKHLEENAASVSVRFTEDEYRLFGTA